MYKNLCPSSQLDAILASEKCDALAMQERIAKCSADYHKTKEVVKDIHDQVTTSAPGLCKTTKDVWGAGA